MTNASSAVAEGLTAERVSLASEIMRRIVSGNLRDEEWRELRGEKGGFLLALSSLWRNTSDESQVYRIKVRGVIKEFVIISPCPGRPWIPAWDFVRRMETSGRITNLDDLAGFAAVYPSLGFGSQRILAGGRELSGRKSDDLRYYDFSALRNGEIVNHSCKGMQEYYRYLALRA